MLVNGPEPFALVQFGSIGLWSALMSAAYTSATAVSTTTTTIIILTRP